MDEGAKRRLVGAAVLVALAVIFVPMLLNDKDDDGLGEPIVIPDSPDFDAGFVGPDDDVAGDALLDSTPALPSPEPPASALSQGRDGDSGMAPLPVSEPSATAASRPRPEPESSARTSPDARPATPAPRTSTAAVGPKPVPAGAAAWVIQVASLGSAAAAETLQNDLRGKGYPAFVEQARVNGKLYYRVRVGPETDRGRADSVAGRLQRETGDKPLVQSYR
jgi:DedD protein